MLTDSVFHSRAFGEPRPLARGVGFGFELFGKRFVFADRNAFHHPFVAGERAVKTPVNEHAEPGFVPPSHAARAVCRFVIAR
jgi:hypothetical protein